MKKILLIMIVVLIIDIITKQLITNNLLVNESITIIKNIFNITYAKNTGIAFSFLEGKVPIIILLTILIIIVIFSYVKNNNKTNSEKILYGLILGGALGNLLDRIIYGYVIDFIDIHFYSNHFPTFNIADSCIVIGIILLIIFSKEGETNEDKSPKTRKNRQISIKRTRGEQN